MFDVFFYPFCGFSSTSSSIEGALSPNMKFFYLDRTEDEFGVTETDRFFNVMDIVESISDDFVRDEENDLIIGQKGAVLDAYNLEDVKDLSIMQILEENQRMYPDYDLELVEEIFPLDVRKGNGLFPEDLELSTHVLYIKNYKDILDRVNSKQEEKPKVKSFLKRHHLVK